MLESDREVDELHSRRFVLLQDPVVHKLKFLAASRA
jgi:hypothetical protein